MRVSEDLAGSANVRQGSRVVVSGLTHGNNIWTADSISAAPSGVTGQDTSRFFYFTGKVSRSDPWTAAGIEFRMPEQNQITGTISVSPTQAIRVGDLISVRGAIDNEVWRADSVQLVGRPQSSLFMVGVVEDENPLTVRGMQFETNSATLTAGDLTRGTRVQILATPITKNRWMIVRAGEIGLNPNTNFGELALLQGEKQVTICHKPGGNPGKAYTIALPAQKARMHIIEHNDTIGACE